ncbi:uncharacterized protein HKW66_Vig0151250 [Vigna angularis]|uniref:Uncharacterized protein n=1 Tax=Phaseolus angularis TaxID=3914 RepID=A0A8T0JTU5_PHAAN|nr:uncharacterized protein HKW66_Vig0151250 [Vigna angularis]
MTMTFVRTKTIIIIEKDNESDNQVGNFVGGLLSGALIGQETESGFIRGAAVGAISRTVFSIEVFESSLVL